jgi:hypothetical protein
MCLCFTVFEICGLRGRAGISFSRLVVGTIGNRENLISLSIISVPKMSCCITLIQLLHCILMLVLSFVSRL